ncbi:hypothetical protein HMPREF9123_2885 [Neisseria bacilliformis ATCC BAA-1200]|uniref:Uncharacterized protein n=2 Tax=Neisseria TaxID=482 RepID=F2BGM8_9NEIS|nr:hypothetical protein HMPREF9123_2885 [Neisseria bacilliformis ATCC BAA-1200]
MVFCALLFILTVGISFRNVVDVLDTYRQKSLFVIDEQGINYAPVGIIAWQDIEYIQPYLENNRGPVYIYGVEIKIKNPEIYAGKIKPHKRKSFQRLHILKIPRVLLPLTAKKIVKQIAQEYGSYYLFHLDEHGLTAAQLGTIAWQDIESIQVFFELPYSHGLTIKLKHPEPYLSNIPPHERKAFLNKPEFHLSPDWLPLPAKTLLQQIEQEYGGYYQPR